MHCSARSACFWHVRVCTLVENTNTGTSTKYTCDKDQSRNKSMTGTRGAGMGVVFKQGSSAFVVCVQCRVVADTQILLIAKKLLGAAHRKRPWISVT